MAVDKLQALRNSGLQIDNPDFLKEYEGQKISLGDDIYDISGGTVNYLGNANPQASAEAGRPDFKYNFGGVIGFDPMGGLAPVGKSSFTKDEAFRYLTPQQKADVIEHHNLNPEDTRFGATVTPEQQQAALASTGGEGAARLEAERIAQAGGVQATGGQLTATFKGDANIPQQTFTGSKEEIEAKARAAGINPVNLFYGNSTTPGVSGELVAPPVGVDNPSGDNVTNAVASGDIPFKAGLDPAQQASIQKLLSNRPDTGTWTPTDIANWNYATNNAPLPGGGATTINATDALTPEQRTGLDAAAQRAAQGTANETDLENLQYAQENYGYEAPEVRDEKQQQVDKLLADNNIEIDPEQEPKAQFKDVFQQSLLDSGAISAKAQAESYAKELRELNDKKDEEIRDINDNPWLTEGIRLRRIQSIEGKYEGKIGNLTGQFNLSQNLYETAVSQAQFVASQSMTQNRWQQEMDQSLEFKLMDQAIKELEFLSDNELNELLSPTEAAALGVPFGTTKGEAFGQIPKSVLTGQDKIEMEVKLAGNFEQYAKDSRSAQRQIGIMEQGYKAAVQAGFDGTSNNAPSQAVLVTFQKLLDPTSVVRESEYARSGDGQSLAQRMKGTIEKLQRGGAGVTQSELQNFYNLSQQLLKGYEAEQLNYARRIKTQADNYGLNIENILTPDVINLLDEFDNENKLPEITQSFNTLEDFIKTYPEYIDVIEDIANNNPNLTDAQVQKKLLSGDFNKDLSMSKNYLSNYGAITGMNGSPYWKWGLDVDLKKGDPVYSPVSGTVIAVGSNGGFGNQIKIKGSDGREYWLSHLDGFKVKKGQKVNAGSLVGLGGNTGKVIAQGGGDGSHLDITVKDRNGNYIPAKQVYNLLV